MRDFTLITTSEVAILKVLEIALDTKLRICGIKVESHIELRKKTLKMQFQTIHEMLTRLSCNDLG